MNDKAQLIVALDVSTPAEALELVKQLRGMAGMFKVGSQLFTAAGPSLVREIIQLGEKIFLDLKFHDIPNTVAAASVEAARLGVSMFNVHAAGGSEMMRRTVEAVSEAADKEGFNRPLIIAVTVLTSVDTNTLVETGLRFDAPDLAARLASLADASGLDGVVASPQEVEIVRAAVSRPDFVVVTPGVRPTGSAAGDQKRITTPKDAVLAGADYLVVGRPILEAENPVKATRAILDEIALMPGMSSSAGT